jgi:hypothetical protein
MPDRSDAARYRSEYERLIALADSCPYAQYKRPLFEIAAQYGAAARRIESEPAPAEPRAPRFPRPGRAARDR